MLSTVEAGILLLAAALVAAGCGPLDGSPIRASAEQNPVPVWGLFETRGELLLPIVNPFDPNEVDLTGEFIAPDGSRISSPGFAYRDFERRLEDGVERLTRRGPVEWRVRFTPTAPGTWQWRWTVTTAQGIEESPWDTFEVSAPEAGHHGFLRVSPDDRRYLRFDDGAPYFAVGENLAWYDSRGTGAYAQWLDRLADSGGNFIRIWMPSWAFGLQWIERDATGAVVESTLSDYTLRLDRAWQLDDVIDQAAHRDIQVMFCVLNHGPFSLTSNSQWDDNPYNRANGGPLDTPDGFFVDPVARELFRRQLRYVVARWGHSPAILAWELWNEVDLTHEKDGKVLAAWHEEMAGHLRALDAYDHLVTTSVSGPLSLQAFGIADALFSLPQMDLAQIHMYGWSADPVDFTTRVPEEVDRYQARYRKPVLASELGVDWSGPGETLRRDPHASGFHDLLWTGLFSGAFGTGMSWWWDNVVDPMDLYFHFKPLAALTRPVAFDREAFQPNGATAEAAGRRLSAFALRGRTTSLVWIKNADNLYFQRYDEAPIEGGVLRVTGLPDGAYLARWIHTYDGESPPATSATAVSGELSLAIPTFTFDLALRLERQP